MYLLDLHRICKLLIQQPLSLLGEADNTHSAMAKIQEQEGRVFIIKIIKPPPFSTKAVSAEGDTNLAATGHTAWAVAGRGAGQPEGHLNHPPKPLPPLTNKQNMK